MTQLINHQRETIETLVSFGRFGAADDERGRNYLKDNPVYARSLARAYAAELRVQARL